MTEKTLGEKRIGIDFNDRSEGGDLGIHVLKMDCAQLINCVDSITLVPIKAIEYADGTSSAGQEPPINGEIRRLKALAITCIEEAEMWAQKAEALSRAHFLKNE